MYLNFNPRQYKDKIFPSPQESAVEATENAAYEYSVDISALPGLAEEVARLRQQWASGEQAASEAEYICAFIHSDFIFDNSDWGSYFPRYEVLIGADGAVVLRPYDFRALEGAAIERRHKIERHIAENVRLETELKGIRKALFSERNQTLRLLLLLPVRDSRADGAEKTHRRAGVGSLQIGKNDRRNQRGADDWRELLFKRPGGGGEYGAVAFGKREASGADGTKADR